MPFEAGQSGNPGGRPKVKPITDAIRIALNEANRVGDGKRLRELAEKLVDIACEGDTKAAALILDRIEGKVPQAIEGGEDGAPITVILKQFVAGRGD